MSDRQWSAQDRNVSILRRGGYYSSFSTLLLYSLNSESDTVVALVINHTHKAAALFIGQQYECAGGGPSVTVSSPDVVNRNGSQSQVRFGFTCPV